MHVLDDGGPHVTSFEHAPSDCGVHWRGEPRLQIWTGKVARCPRHLQAILVMRSEPVGKIPANPAKDVPQGGLWSAVLAILIRFHRPFFDTITREAGDEFCPTAFHDTGARNSFPLAGPTMEHSEPRIGRRCPDWDCRPISNNVHVRFHERKHGA